MHCCICDFCETVPAARNYVTDFVHHGNKVIWHEKLKDFYCFECIEQIGIWRRAYQDDAAKFIEQAELAEQAITREAHSERVLDEIVMEETEDIDPKEVQRNPFALSEV